MTISVSNLPPSTESGAREAFLQRVDEFEALYPNIDIEPNEYEWDIATFAAQLAGGTLPTVFQIPFTDSQGLIQRGQIADISAEVADAAVRGRLQPERARGQPGRRRARSTAFRSRPTASACTTTGRMFEEAGLDPDAPPTTWDEVREYAAAIAEATGQAGYAQMSQNNTGGWMLTTLELRVRRPAPGRHGRRRRRRPSTTRARSPRSSTCRRCGGRTTRWASNFLLDWGTINQAFAAGQVGMYMGGSDVYNSLVTENDIDPTTYGLTVLPLEGADAGVLGGGTIASVRADASDAERDAAVKWIDFFYMAKLTNQEAALADAEALAANDAPIGTPALPIFSAEQLAESDAWVADLVNVPLAQMMPFKDNILEQPLIPEPPANTQEMYAILDSVVQTVLTDEGADIAALLADADADVTALVEEAAG